jgi:hypothetical protein
MVPVFLTERVCPRVSFGWSRPRGWDSQCFFGNFWRARAESKSEASLSGLPLRKVRVSAARRKASSVISGAPARNPKAQRAPQRGPLYAKFASASRALSSAIVCNSRGFFFFGGTPLNPEASQQGEHRGNRGKPETRKSSKLGGQGVGLSLSPARGSGERAPNTPWSGGPHPSAPFWSNPKP